MSPRMALRRWPMCAALLGLMLVCSTRILPGRCDIGHAAVRGRAIRAAASCFAVDPGVDVARARDLQLLEALEAADPGDNFFGDLARCLAQLLGQFESERQGVLAQLHLGRLLDDDLRQIETRRCAQKVAHVLGEPSFADGDTRVSL